MVHLENLLKLFLRMKLKLFIELVILIFDLLLTIYTF